MRTLTWVAPDPQTPLYHGSRVQCPLCTKRWRVRKRVLARYRRHFFRRHG